ncbi:protein get1 [Ceraceosorus bombacis]|uniref:Protein get1 n=1 Tax=Ceraceosorus bombacis TaxID=401625 RepID=A0A0P1BH05_9BASI|nr:protein get1 [Ceraceosorus bombacis]
MHPALLIILVVLFSTLLSSIGHARLSTLILPIWLRLTSASTLAANQRAKKELLQNRLLLGQTSAQDDFSKWAKIRRKVDKLTQEIEGSNAKLQSAQSTLTLLVRAGLIVLTTVMPFLVTSYHSKTPMFFLPPAAAGTREGSTWFGPIGWALSLAAAPAGSVSAGAWSAVVTRVLTLLISGVKDVMPSASSDTKSAQPTERQSQTEAKKSASIESVKEKSS